MGCFTAANGQMGASKNEGPLVGTACNEDHTVLRSCTGPLIFRNSYMRHNSEVGVL